MTDHVLAPYSPLHIPELSKLWHQTFGDPEELIENFFRCLPDIGVAALALYEGKAVGAAYSLDAMDYLDKQGRFHKCGYIYAVAVSPEHRHFGLGRKLCQMAAELSRQRGAEIICTLPAEESLYPWYQEIMGLECLLHRSRTSYSSKPSLECRQLSSLEYLARREDLLQGRPHLLPGPELMDFAESFYKCFGGGLYLCGGALAAVYGDEKQAIIRELILPPDQSPVPVAESLGAELKSLDVLLFLPSAEGEPYLSAPPDILPADCVWNLSFD